MIQYLYFLFEYGVRHTLFVLLVVTLNIQISFLLRWIFVNSNDFMKLSSRKNRQEILYNLILETNNHKINRILSKVTDEILNKSDGFGMWKGQLIFDKFLSKVFFSFPDFRMKLLNGCYGNDNPEITMSEINIVGQQRGSFMGNPPSGKEFSINGVFVFEFDKSIKIKTIRVYYDSKMIYNQLDIMKV